MVDFVTTKGKKLHIAEGFVNTLIVEVFHLGKNIKSNFTNHYRYSSSKIRTTLEVISAIVASFWIAQ